MSSLEERVADLALVTFNGLPIRSKPRRQTIKGVQEWIPMSAIVLAKDAGLSTEKLTCVALATGSKCLPASSVPKCKGQVLHDSHAEVLALRALNRFLLAEVLALLQTNGPQYQSSFLRFNEHISGGEHGPGSLPFKIRPNISIYMYCSEAPCGDASMELLMVEQGRDVIPWPIEKSRDGGLKGRGYFSALGEVRRKPSRPDAEASLSKSCTDKLAVKQVTSLLTFPASIFIAPSESAYLSGLVVPSEKHSETGSERAFGRSGRMNRIDVEQMPHPFQYRPFKILTLPADHPAFPFRQPSAKEPSAKPGNVSAVFSKSTQLPFIDMKETVIGGVKQGYKQFTDDRKKASDLSRAMLWTLAVAIFEAGGKHPGIPAAMKFLWLQLKQPNPYSLLKAQEAKFTARGKCKTVVTDCLGGWTRNTGDEDWHPESIRWSSHPCTRPLTARAEAPCQEMATRAGDGAGNPCRVRVAEECSSPRD